MHGLTPNLTFPLLLSHSPTLSCQFFHGSLPLPLASGLLYFLVTIKHKLIKGLISGLHIIHLGWTDNVGPGGREIIKSDAFYQECVVLITSILLPL